MKTLTNSFSTKLVIFFVLCLFAGAHGYAGNQPEKTTKAVEVNSKIDNDNTHACKTAKVIKSELVNDVWKDMVSYDRFGNEITPRARENMRNNSQHTNSHSEISAGVK